MFSPYYARARRRSSPADPQQHNAVNVALYGARGHRWAMTERGAGALQRDAASLRIGPSRLAWREDRLHVDIDERCAPWGTRLRGRVAVEPLGVASQAHALDAAGRHLWSPIAPVARIDVQFDRPALRWRGHAYLDANRGERALAADFLRWDWSRAALPGGRAAALYDVVRHDGTPLSLALRFDAAGRTAPFEPPPQHLLPPSGWRIARQARSDAGSAPDARRALEDGPFYARSLLAARWDGEPVLAVHESLSLQRFDARWVQALLPFRMPRRAA